MKDLLIFLFIGLTSFSSFGQASSQNQSYGTNDGLIGSNNRYGSIAPKGEISYEESLAEYKMMAGSPFLHKGEIVVDIIAANDSILKSVTILYDLYNQEIVAMLKKGGTIILDQVFYKGFIYNNRGVEEKYMRVHPSDLKFYQILFQNEDFIFCKLDEITVSDDTRHIPGKDSKMKRFNSKTRYYIFDGEEVKKVTLQNELLVNHIPNKYRTKVYKIKKKLKIKKLKKEEDYLLLMKEF